MGASEEILAALQADPVLAEVSELDRTTFPSGLTDQLRAELTSRAVQLRHEHRDLERISLVEEIQALSRRERTKPAAV